MCVALDSRQGPGQEGSQGQLHVANACFPVTSFQSQVLGGGSIGIRNPAPILCKVRASLSSSNPVFLLRNEDTDVHGGSDLSSA